jgi:hypothetical protein
MSERGCLSFWLREPRRTGFEEMYGRVRVAELIRIGIPEADHRSCFAQRFE